MTCVSPSSISTLSTTGFPLEAVLQTPCWHGTAWYATYTCAHRERRVAEQMERRGLDCFLPTYRSVRRWKDRRKELSMPLFPGYVFVNLDLRERRRVLEIAGVVHIVSFDGKPAPLPIDEIENLRSTLSRECRMELHPYLKKGCRVRVRSGALAGLDGILVRRKDRYRLVLSVSLIMRSIAVEVEEADVEPLV